jgi:Rps23 Pro-64 3,4-dihydroxylase Tpa1-like proline 4-hydroxylase
MIKLNQEQINESNTNIFGDWLNDRSLVEKFLTAKPFEHVVIDGFLEKGYAEQVYNSFPTDIDAKHWWKYCNPLEVKYANDNLEIMPNIIRNIFYALSSTKIIQKMCEISNIPNLEYDEYLHGAGLHIMPRYGRLNMHLDYEKHPITNKERRLNIILYLSKDWKEEWNGETQLWNKDMTECVTKSPIAFNRAIIFKTNDVSWHGLPEIITCPEGTYRKSLAYYYVSPLVSKSSTDKVGANDDGYRTKATYVKRPQDEFDPRMEKLFRIRSQRRITSEDMNEIWSDWNIKQ